jgi:hypothetical protein
VYAVPFEIASFYNQQSWAYTVGVVSVHELGQPQCTRGVIACYDNVFLANRKRTIRWQPSVDALALTVKAVHIGVNDTALRC